VNEIIKGEVEFSPIRSIARIRPTSRQSIKWPVRKGTFSAAWTGEKETKSEATGLTYGMEEIYNHEMSAYVDVSNQDLEDAAFDIEGELRNEFAEQFGVCEGAAFVSGNAVKKPEGFLANSNISYTASGVADELTADGIINITFDLKTAYAKNAYFVLSRKTLKTVATLKDGAGQYLWKPFFLETGAPMRIYGYPYIEAVDMPDIAAGTYPIAFGDFRRGYLIIDRIAMELQRDPYTQNISGLVRFVARKRVGGQVILAEAIRKLKIAAS
jgi:HK97 family phage major capsid protein